jgi:hypothetical protein
MVPFDEFVSWKVLVCDELSVSSTPHPSSDRTLHGSRLKSDRSLLKNKQKKGIVIELLISIKYV